MNVYIGTKMIKGEPMTRHKFLTFEKGDAYPPNEKDQDGYKVVYKDGYKSWSPKEVFEKAYMKLASNNNTISQDDVDNFIKETHVSTIGEKTTLVRVILANGFEIIEASACADKANYDEKLGKEICMKKIKDKVWYLLGFLLQTAKDGVK